METLTREELFDLVWTTPLSKLAARFGISDVALGKTCARFDIPRPGRGYWQQLAVGAKPKRPRLPPSRDGKSVVLPRVRSATGKGERDDPTVVVPDKLSEPHPAVRWLEGEFASAKPDAYGRLVVTNSYGPAFSVRPAHVRRLLRIMDALAKALTERGHEVVAARRSESLSCPDFLVRPSGEKFALEVEEKLAQKPHAPTAKEKERKAKWGHDFQKYDYFPDGELRLKLKYTHYKYVGHTSWSDTKTRRLDDLLGRAVLAIEDAGTIGRTENEEAVRLAEQFEIEKRKRLRGERLRWYHDWVTGDLDRMLDGWDRARRIRDFMKDYDQRLPEEARNEVAARWSQAVLALADRIDPLHRAAEIAKEMEPSDEVLAGLVAEEAKRAESASRRVPTR